MNDDRRRDDIVHGWFLTEAPERAPGGLADLIRDQVVDTRQEWPAARFRLDLRVLRLAAAGMALLVLSLLLGIAIGSPHPGPSPTPTETPIARAIPSQSAPSPAPTPKGVVLPAGEVASLAFTPPISLVLPAGWTLEEDSPAYLSLARPDAGHVIQGDGALYFDAIRLYGRPVAGLPDGTLGGVPGVGTSARELATWLSERPQLTSTAPVKTTLAGLTGYQLDFALSADAGDLCGIKCVNLLDSADDGPSYRFGIEGDWRVRAFLLDAPDGSTVMVTIEDTDGVRQEEEIAAGMSILNALRFIEPVDVSASPNG
jgi:hypothetical protein